MRLVYLPRVETKVLIRRGGLGRTGPLPRAAAGNLGGLGEVVGMTAPLRRREVGLGLSLRAGAARGLGSRQELGAGGLKP